MFDFFQSNWIIFAGAALTWLIFMLGVAQLSRFYAKFVEMRRINEADMQNVIGQQRKMMASMSEIIIELRRTNKLLLEQLDLKKAELTGEFEIVEEPVNNAEN